MNESLQVKESHKAGSLALTALRSSGALRLIPNDARYAGRSLAEMALGSAKRA